MGDPKKLRKKYSTPSHPWQRERIAEEKKVQDEYGLKNKLEIWKANSLVQKIRNQAKTFVVSLDDDATAKSKEFIKNLYEAGFINSADAAIDDVLTLKIENILDRRLQTVMLKKELVLTSKQARKFITHKHVVVSGKVITSPGYLVTREDELNISFRETSPLNSEAHPTREAIKNYLTKDDIKTEEIIEEKKTEKVDAKKEVKVDAKKENKKGEKK